MWIILWSHLSMLRCVFDLMRLFTDRARTAVRDGLISGCKNTTHGTDTVQRIDRHQCDRCGAIWIREEAPMAAHILRVYLGNNQRHVRLHPENRRVVDCNGVCLAGNRNIFSRDLSARAEKGDVDLVE